MILGVTGLRKYSLDERFFTSIDSERKAYWLGFICADGHVSDDGVTIVLNDGDLAHLKQFAVDVGSNSPINVKPGRATIHIYSQAMVADLRSLGLFRNKSHSLALPNIPRNLLRHFLRGLFDGDGSIKITTRLKKRYVNLITEYTVMFCGTSSVMESVLEILIVELGVSRVVVQRRGSLCVVEWGGRPQVLRILNWLYESCVVALPRKKDRWLGVPRL